MEIRVHFFATATGFGFGLTPMAAVDSYLAANPNRKALTKLLLTPGASVMYRLPAGIIRAEPGWFPGTVEWYWPEGVVSKDMPKPEKLAKRGNGEWVPMTPEDTKPLAK